MLLKRAAAHCPSFVFVSIHVINASQSLWQRHLLFCRVLNHQIVLEKDNIAIWRQPWKVTCQSDYSDFVLVSQLKSSCWDAKEVPGRELQGGHSQSPQGWRQGSGGRPQEAAGRGCSVAGDWQTCTQERAEKGELSLKGSFVCKLWILHSCAAQFDFEDMQLHL